MKKLYTILSIIIAVIVIGGYGYKFWVSKADAEEFKSFVQQTQLESIDTKIFYTQQFIRDLRSDLRRWPNDQSLKDQIARAEADLQNLIRQRGDIK